MIYFWVKSTFKSNHTFKHANATTYHPQDGNHISFLTYTNMGKVVVRDYKAYGRFAIAWSSVGITLLGA